MPLPFVSRAAFEALQGERDWLRVEVARLADENRSLTNAMLANARLVPAFASGSGRKEHAWTPRRKTINDQIRELEQRTAEKPE